MNNEWSKKVQSTELLYFSRRERFNDENKDLWFDLLKVKDGMKVLEVGCGGGLFTNMIKKHFPNCEVYGIDIDDEHIKFAKKKAKELGLEVNYSVANINKLPFESDYFDLVFSHTVVEHVQFDEFIKEQKRVLKIGANLVIMRVDMNKKVDRPFEYLEDEIGETFDKLVFSMQPPQVAKFLEEPDQTMRRLVGYEFKNIDFRYDRIVFYMPDIEKDKEKGLEQIKRNYESKLYNGLFALGKAENGEQERNQLLTLLEQQYLRRKQLYMLDEKLFDFQSTNMITISATK